ncbi:MAG: ATP synthase F0 subunit A [Ignavibacteria bacterium GWA2_35_9]|nr:MAG: ATP synthase F0 subunit A [Ignavibacteria bacterium GWA2_35_9]OGU48121.1 MAG: ATP synthase F0 subunit A [Ignavibacteria bacterium GWC2_36_12]
MLIEGIKDTLATNNMVQHSSAGEGGDWILHHILDNNYLDFEPFGTIPLPHLELFGIDLSITRYVVFMWVVAVLLILILASASKAYKKSLIPRGFVNIVEMMIIFVRDEIVRPTIGKDYQKYLSYLLTIFFFILFSNLFGLLPYSATITSNIAVTAALAGLSFIMTQLGGIRNYGFFGYFKAMVPHGMPTVILPLIIVVEILGLFTKPFALCIRLFANMIAGHVVILSLIGLIFIMGSIFVAPVSIVFALFIYMLELLVALIQAYIFTMLSSLFIGMAAHQEH